MSNDQRTISNADITLTNGSSFTSNGVINVNGGMYINTTSIKQTNYTIDSNNVLDYIVPINTTTNSITITLPATVSTGRLIIIIDIGNNITNNNCIISGNGKNIDSSSTLTMTQNYMSVSLWYNGTFWSVI